MNCCKPEQVGTEEHGKMLKRIPDRRRQDPCQGGQTLEDRRTKEDKMMSTRTRANAPRFRASSLRALTPGSARVCCRCMKMKGLGRSHAPRRAWRPLCGSHVVVEAQSSPRPRLWKLTSTSTRSAFAWAVLVLRNPSLVLPAIQAFWTRARRTPPAAPSGRLRVVTTLSHPFSMQPHSSVTTPLKWRFLASSLARI